MCQHHNYLNYVFVFVGLQLRSGTLPFSQFSAVYTVPSVPCIHVISPFGEVLSTKTAQFSQEEISLWLDEIRMTFG